jgi:probable phosphoglycerate mutase
MSRRLIVEADGGSRGNPGPAAYGAVVKDAATGAVLVERAEAIGIATNNVAEYRGVIAGLEEAHRVDPDSRIEVRLDSKLVVEQMTGRWKIKHADMRELALRARSTHDMSAVTFTWVPRSKNVHADRLLNEVLDTEAPEPERRPLLRPAMGEPTTFYLLRHGETALTVQRRFSGRGGVDVGLTDDGRAQVAQAANALSARLGASSLAAIVTSPLLRTQQSAQIVAERVGADVTLDDGLAEMAFGEWDGLTFGEARRRDPALFDAWLADPAMPAPGGESLVDVAARVTAVQQRLRSQFQASTVLLVSHAMPVKVLVAAALQAPIESVHRVDVTPASLAELAFWPDGRPSLRALGLR